MATTGGNALPSARYETFDETLPLSVHAEVTILLTRAGLNRFLSLSLFFFFLLSFPSFIYANRPGVRVPLNHFSSCPMIDHRRIRIDRIAKVTLERRRLDSPISARLRQSARRASAIEYTIVGSVLFI